MNSKLTFPYSVKRVPTTKEQAENVIEDSGDTLYERITGRMTFPLKEPDTSLQMCHNCGQWEGRRGTCNNCNEIN